MPATLHTVGIAAASGDKLATARPLQTSGTIWYVSSVTGDNTYSGQTRERPKVDLAGALATASAYDVIVCMDGHSESPSSTFTLSSAITIVGEGLNAGKPGVTFTRTGTVTMFDITGADVHLRGLYMPNDTATTSTPRVQMAGARASLTGVYMEGNENLNNALVQITTAATSSRLTGCTFVSNATDETDVPTNGIFLSSGTHTDLSLEDCVFDGGENGFSTWAFNATNAVNSLRGLNISLLRGADAAINAATTGYFNVQTATGASRVNWL